MLPTAPVPSKAAAQAPVTVLVIDPNEEHQALSTAALSRQGFRVVTADDAREGLRLASSQTFAAIVVDHKIRDLSALDVARALSSRLPDVPIVFVVSSGSEELALRALEAGAAGYLVKTPRYNELLPAEVRQQIEKARSRHRIAEQEEKLIEEMRGRDEAESRLLESEAKLRLATAQVPGILWTTDADLRLTSIAGAGVALLGLDSGAILGRGLSELFAMAGSGEVPMGSHGRALRGESSRYEIKIRSRDFEIRLEPLRDSRGRIVGCLGVGVDITDRKREEQLREAIYRISEATNSGENLGQLFEMIHETISGLMPAKNFYIALYDPVHDTLSYPYFADEEETAPSPQKLGRGLTEYVLRTGKALLASPEVFESLVRSGEVESVGPPSIDWVGVPLTAGDRTIGVLVVQSYTEGVRYGEPERDILSFVSHQIATAVDRKKSQEQLREAHRTLRALVDASPLAIYSMDGEGRVRMWNPAAGRLFGWGESEVLGRMLPTVPEDRIGEFEGLREEALTQGGFTEREVRRRRKDGSLVDLSLSMAPLRSSDGSVGGIVAVAVDISARKRAEEALRYRETLEGLITAISTQFIDLPTDQIDGGITQALRAVGEFAGVDRSFAFSLSPEGKILRVWEWHEETLDSIGPRYAGFDTSLLPWLAEHLRQDEAIAVSRTADLPPDATAEREVASRFGAKSLLVVPMSYHGALLGHLGFVAVREEKDWPEDVVVLLRIVGEIFVNAMARRSAEQDSDRTERKFRTLFNAAADPILLIDRKGRIIDINPAGEQVLVRTRASLLGASLQEIMPAEEIPRTRAYLDDLLSGNAVEEPFQTTVHSPGKGRRMIEVRSRAVFEPGLEPYVEIIARDVTEQKDLQRRLLESERQAALGQMAAHVAHEINTPLTNIALLTASIARKTTDREVLERLERVNVQRRTAATILSDLLTLSRPREIRAQETDLREVVRDALEHVASLRPAEVALEKAFGDEPVRMHVDPLEMQVVVANLVKNAYQATTAGVVKVRIEETAEEVVIFISDTGAGMTREVQSHLFQPFFTTKKMGVGTGLGLSICRNIVTAHGGTIHAESEAGKGSTFIVRLPKGVPPRPSAAAKLREK